MRKTAGSVADTAHTDPLANVIPFVLSVSIVAITSCLTGSILSTVDPSRSDTQTLPAPTAMPDGRPKTGIEATTAFVDGSICATNAPASLASQTALDDAASESK